MWLTVYQKRCWRNLVATMFIGQCCRLFDGGEMFGGGRCVNMAHLYSWRRWSLDVTLGCKKKSNICTPNIKAQSDGSFTENKNKQRGRLGSLPLNKTDATSRSEFTWSWMFLLSSSLSDLTNLEQTFISKRLGKMNLMPMATFWVLASSGFVTSVLMVVKSGITQIPSMSSETREHSGPLEADTVVMSIFWIVP